MINDKRIHSIQWSSNCLSSIVSRTMSRDLDLTVCFVSVSINESSSFSPPPPPSFFFTLYTVTNNQDEKCKNFLILLEDGIV